PRFRAATDTDPPTRSLVPAARKITPSLFVAARQNQPASGPLFAAMEIDALLVPTEGVAHEIYAQLSTPLLWRFLRELPAKDDMWAAQPVDRLTEMCGRQLQALWKSRLTPEDAPALTDWLSPGGGPPGGPPRNPGEPGE